MANSTDQTGSRQRIFADPLHNLVINHLKVGLVILDAENLISWANEIVLDWFDSSSSPIGEPAAALFGDQNFEQIVPLISSGSSGDTIFNQINTINGKQRFKISIFDLPHGSNADRVLLFHESSGQITFEEIVQQEKLALKEMVNDLPMAILAFDRDLNCLSCNAFGQKVYNLTGGDMNGRSFKDIFRSKQFPSIQTALAKLTDTGRPTHFIEKYFAADETPRWHQVTLMPKSNQLIMIGVDITDRKLAEQEILQNEERLGTIFESSLISMAVVDLSGKIVYANQQFGDLLGCENGGELIGHQVVDLAIPEERPRAREVFHAFLDEDNIRRKAEEFTLNSKKRHKVLVKVNAKLVHNLSIDQSEIILSFEDITEQRRNEKINSVVYRIAEAAGLSTSLEDLYATIHKTINEIMPANNFYIASYDQEKNTVSFPYFVDERDDLPPPMDADQLGKSITMYVLRTGKSLLCSKEISDELNEKGEVKVYGAFPAIWLGVPLVLEGKTIGVMAVQHYTDEDAYTNREKRLLEFVSTEVAKAIQRKQAESALIESERRFRSVVQFTPIGVHLFRLLTNGELVLISSNAAADKILNSKLELRVGETYEELFPQNAGKELPAILKKIARHGGIHRQEVVNFNQDGRLVNALDLNAFQPSPFEVAVHFQDITARVAYEQEINSLNEELEQRVFQRTIELEASNREMEAFAYSVSHDLRAPVRAVKGFAEILLTDETDQEKMELITRIAESGTRMDQLINDLLSLSRLGSQTLNVQQVDLSAIARSLLEEEVLNAGGRQIEYQVLETPPAVADRDMVRILLSNLVNNAIKFTSARETTRITFGHKPTNGNGVYFIQDNGVGFDMKYAEKVFSPFERLHASEYEGTGIGLAIVYRVIRRHEGHIWVETAPEQGASFYFTFEHPAPKTN